MKIKMFFGLLGILTLPGLVAAQSGESGDLMEWFRDARFGMFIHYGGRTNEAFEPQEFDARQWVRIAKQGGMKYIVYTSKHHNGFCNWDSAWTENDVIDRTDFKRDIIGELADAAKAEGIRLGLYYSIADHHHAEYPAEYSNRNGFHYSPNPNADITRYMVYMYGQIRELSEKYQPSLFWFDGSAPFRPPERKRLLGQQELLDMMHSYGAISNSRLGDDDQLRFVDYLSMGDNMVPASNIGVNFESAGTMNDSWHFDAEDDEWKSPADLLARLVDIAGKGGNYLLNVGPTPDGVIPAVSEARLKTMGDWLATNGEAIYGTNAGPHPYELGWGSITERETNGDSSLYLNVVDWPTSGNFELYGLNNKVLEASLLASDQSLSTRSEFDTAAGVNVVTIDIPKNAPDKYVSVIKLKLAGPASMEQSMMQQRDGAVALDGWVATIHDLEFVPNKFRRLVDSRMFTVPLKGEGIMPGRMMTVDQFNKSGQALHWDFRLLEPGRYDVAVVNLLENGGAAPELDGEMRATVAGQSVANGLKESHRFDNLRLPKFEDSVSILGTVSIATAGMHTLTLEVSSDFTTPGLRLTGVSLLPKPD